LDVFVPDYAPGLFEGKKKEKEEGSGVTEGWNRVRFVLRKQATFFILLPKKEKGREGREPKRRL